MAKSIATIARGYERRRTAVVIAKKVIVDGQSLRAVAGSRGVTQQRIRQIIDYICVDVIAMPRATLQEMRDDSATWDVLLSNVKVKP